ncbi:outer membrane protein [Bartonella florencae]|uniref:outer membrane protein n=1 Tax=Bartonella florencae TaxID=928210 RepID=UPI0002FEEE71|nr:outer membrane protein [Bartonella florencae]
MLVSVTQAADVIVPHEVAPAIAAPSFSWTGFYIGAQLGGFSSKVKVTDSETKERIFKKNGAPQPSGFVGGIYIGSNINLNHALILGIETDVVWVNRGDKKSSVSKILDATGALELNKSLIDAGVKLEETDKFVAGDMGRYGATLKEKWSGTTRVRIGFAVTDRIMPYIAGGVVYTQIQGTDWVSGIKKSINNNLDKTKMFVGFTLGAGIDCAMTDNVLLRAEYRYSDYGKKKFDRDGNEVSYKTNDLRVGVAYKF